MTTPTVSKLIPLAAILLPIFITTFVLAGGQHVIPDYDTARDNFLWPQVYNNGGVSLYCGVAFGAGERLTVEHVYPADWIAEKFGCEDRDCTHPSYKLAEADLHNLWPALGGINSSRGKRLFGEIDPDQRRLPPSASDLDCDYERESGSAGKVEPRDSVKGEIARSLFYMHVEYGLDLKGMRPMLKRWNIADPVDANERSRNDRIEQLQGTRNWFIDNPPALGRGLQ